MIIYGPVCACPCARGGESAQGNKRRGSQQNSRRVVWGLRRGAVCRPHCFIALSLLSLLCSLSLLLSFRWVNSGCDAGKSGSAGVAPPPSQITLFRAERFCFLCSLVDFFVYVEMVLKRTQQRPWFPLRCWQSQQAVYAPVVKVSRYTQLPTLLIARCISSSPRFFLKKLSIPLPPPFCLNQKRKFLPPPLPQSSPPNR